MSIGQETDFSQAILDEAREEADGVVDLARREAERILEGAREELEAIYIAESPQAQKQQASTRYNQIIASAELETRRRALLAQEDVIQQVLEQVRERLQQLRTDERYPNILRALILQGLQELEGETFEALVAPEDRKFVTPALLNELQQHTGKRVSLAEKTPDGPTGDFDSMVGDFDSIVGAIVQRADLRVSCDNTFQAIIQREQAPIRLLIAESLFGETDYE